MGICLILFPDEHHQQIQSTNDNNSISKKKAINFNLFPPSFSLPSSLKSTKSANLLYKAQYAISICALLMFTILLLFIISTLPSTTTTTATRDYHQSRRQLNVVSSSGRNSSTHALQGMGTLYRRGTRAMNDLIVAHAVESLTSHEFRLFLRLLQRSGTTSKSDLLFVFPSKSSVFDRAIREEIDYFMKLVDQYNTNTTLSNNYSSSFSSFKSTHFVKKIDKSKHTGEPIWGRRTRSNLSEVDSAESRRLSYGSVVGFDVEELDPENSLSGFLDHIPMSLRRWACYPMILGRVRRNFKHVTLVDMKEVLLLDDPFDKIRGTAMDSVLVITQSSNEKHGRRNLNKAQKLVTPTIIIGGDRGVRRLSDLMLTEIVRTSIQKKRRNSETESALFNQLVVNPFVLQKVKLIASTESIPESISKANHGMVKRRGNANVDVNYILMKLICSFQVESTVYSDCYTYVDT
ncbi:uncharacterized protein [Primulina huaijiensis]|uniref:uncharacterized protein n=1 Tax=Primulina huaijiensis TaxID=1492673 RepID=UPI003CC6EC6E